MRPNAHTSWLPLVLAAAWPAVGILTAQDSSASGVFPVISREHSLLHEQIEDSRRAKDWDAVVEGLLRYASLGANEESGQPAVISNGAGVARGVRTFLPGWVASLPNDPRDRFRARNDTRLRRALAASDGELDSARRRRLRHEILRDWPDSALAPAMRREEADAALLAGDWRAAREALRQLLQEPLPSEPSPAAVTERARTLLLSCQTQEALEDETGWRESHSRLGRLVEEGLLDPASVDLQWRGQLEAVLAARAPKGRPGSPPAPIFTALRPLCRAVGTEVRFRPGGAVWRSEGGSSELRRFLRERAVARDGELKPWSEIPIPYHPAVGGGALLLQHDDRVVAFDLEKERPRWSFALPPAELPRSVARAPLAVGESCCFVHGNTLYALDLSTGRLLWRRELFYDPDRQELWLLAGPPAPPAPPADIGPRKDLDPNSTSEPPPPNEDDGNEAKRHGAGRPPASDEKTAAEREKGAPGSEAPSPAWTRVAVTSPLVLHEGSIIFGSTVRHGREDICWLVALAPDGRVVWKTLLASVRGVHYLGLGPGGSPPLITGSHIFYLSNEGFVASVDPSDGTVSWLSEYPTLSPRALREAVDDENRWATNPLVPLPGGGMLVAPRDTPWLLAVDEGSGRILWRLPRERHSLLLGNDGERVFLAGRDVSAISLRPADRGRAVWSRAAAELGSRPLGRGLLIPGRVLVSTRDALIQLAARDGEIVARDLWEFPGGGGNLLLAFDRLAVIHPGGFLVYDDRDSFRRRIDESPSPGPEGALTRAKFLLRAGELETGLALLERASAAAPLGDTPRPELDRLRLELSEILRFLARGAPDPLADRLWRARVRIETIPARRVAAAIDLARRLESRGDPGAALEAYHLALRSDVPPTEYSPREGVRVPSEAFVRDRIRALRKGANASSTTFRSVEEAAAKALRDARGAGQRGGGDVAVSYRELLRRYPYTRAAADAALELATMYQDYENFEAAADRLLDFLEDYPDSPRRAEVGLRAAQLLFRSGQRTRAKALYQSLRERYGNTTVSGVAGIAPGERLRAYVDRRLSDPGLAEVEVDPQPEFRLPAEMVWRSPADLLAANRTFLFPRGTPPSDLRDCFFTQSGEYLHCRRLDTGLPVWELHLRSIPGFLLDPLLFGVHFARTRDKVIEGSFVADRLVLHDHRNLFAIDALSGKPRWHHPFEPGGAEASSVGVRLSERLRGVAVAGERIFAASNRKRVYAFDLDGQILWSRSFSWYLAPGPPLPAGDTVWLLRQPRTELVALNAEDGAVEGSFEGAFEAGVRHLPVPPLPVGEDRLLVTFAHRGQAWLRLLDLRHGRVAWTFVRERGSPKKVFWSPRWPDEAILSSTLSNGLPSLLAVSLSDGQELWRYERPPTGAGSVELFRDGERLYVIHGNTEWKLLGLRISRGSNRGKRQISALWKPREISLGTFFGSTRRKLHITPEAVLFPDAGSVSVYDKLDGKTRGDLQDRIARFLVEKGSFTTALIGGRLVLLTDGGDCAFATRREPATRARRRLRLVQEYLARPGSAQSVISLALDFFRDGDRAGVISALDLLDEALRSEEILAQEGGKRAREIAYLLEGIKEEALKHLPSEEITSPRMWQPPEIDGRLEDAWDTAYRVRLGRPRNVGRIAQPGRTRDWEGEEDLSAILYTGWDDESFFFALDVEDDALRAYDREAEIWKGDCLLIGLDPDGNGGYRQGGGDQLMTLALTVPKRKPPRDDKDDPDREGAKKGDKNGNGVPDEDEERTPEGQFSVKRKDDGSGAIYEVALPWSSFGPRFAGGKRPPRGYRFGLSLLLTDDDTGHEATKTLSLNACHLLPRNQKHLWIWKFLIPEFFPRVRLR